MPRPARSLIGLSTACMLATAPLCAHAAQNDFFPTDYVALPDGGMNVAVYAATQSLNGKWNNGVRTSPLGEIDTRLLAIRASRHFSVGDQGQYTIAPVVVLSTADSRADTEHPVLIGKQASGFGDLKLGVAFWPYVDRVNREYFLTAAFVSLPTGDYDKSQILNIGENRIKTILSAGWMKTLGERWVVDLASEVAFFGDNKSYLSAYTLSQDTAYAVTGTARYKLTPSLHWYSSAQLNRGGATQFNGNVTGAPENTRLALGALLFTSDTTQLQLRYAQDVAISNGYRTTNEVVLRWSTVFR